MKCMGRQAVWIVIVFLLTAVVFWENTKSVSGAEENPQKERTEIAGGQQEAEQQAGGQQKEKWMLDQLDIQNIEHQLQDCFPSEKMSFRDLVESLMQGEMTEVLGTIGAYIKSQLFYDFDFGRKTLGSIIVTAIIAAVFSIFANAFHSKQVSEISFYLLYLFLMTLCLSAFRTSVYGVVEKLKQLNGFMGIACPCYFLVIALVSGTTVSTTFYHLILLLIYLLEQVVINGMIPLLQVFVLSKMLSNVTEDDLLSEFSSLLKKVMIWGLRTLLTFIVGLNLIQGMLSPAIDSVKRNAVYQTIQAVPWVGSIMGGVTEVALGTAVLVKNSIGMAGACIVLTICAVPFVQMLMLAGLFKMAAAVVQPVSDKRITSCISGVSEGFELLVKILFTSALLFLITIVVAAGITS